MNWRLSSNANCQKLNQSCLCDETSIKTQKDGIQSFWISEHMNFGESGTLGESMEALCPFLLPYLIHFLIWLLIHIFWYRL